MRKPTSITPDHFFERSVSEHWVYFDTETTGVASNDEIITIGFVTNNNECEYKVKPAKARVHPQAAKVHGISNLDIERFHTYTLSQALDQVGTWLADRPINGLVAWNARFDVRMYEQSVEAEGTKSAVFDDQETLCAMDAISEFCAFKMPSGSERSRMSLSLDAACLLTGTDTSARDDTHDALIDTRLIPLVVNEMCAHQDMYKAIGQDIERVMERVRSHNPKGIGLLASALVTHKSQLGAQKNTEGNTWILNPRFKETTDAMWDFWRAHKPLARLLGFQPRKSTDEHWVFEIPINTLREVVKAYQHVPLSR